MRKIKGLNVWPLAVESVVFEHDAVADYQVVLSSADGGQDVATLWVEPAQHLKTADVHALSECLAGAVERRVGIRFEIEIVDPEEAAFDRNIEVGVLTRDAALAAALARHFQALIDHGLLVPLPSS